MGMVIQDYEKKQKLMSLPKILLMVRKYRPQNHWDSQLDQISFELNGIKVHRMA